MKSAPLIIFIAVGLQSTDALSQDFVVGTRDSHKELWEGRVAQEAKEQGSADLRVKYKRESEAIHGTIRSNSDELKRLESGYYNPIKKDEFETTEEYEKRKNLRLKYLVHDLKTKNKKLRDRLAELDKLILTNTPKPSEAPLLLHVTMGKYDADTKKIPGFYYDKESEFITADGDLCIFQILNRPVSPIIVDLDKAKEIRAASDLGLLYLYVDSIPYYTSYYDLTTRKKDPEQLAEEIKRNRTGDLALSTFRLLLGDEEVSFSETSVVGTMDVKSKRIIVSWNNDHSPIQPTYLLRLNPWIQPGNATVRNRVDQG